MTLVAISGAAGNVGRMLRRALPARAITLRSADLHPLAPWFAGEDLVHGDLRDAAVVDRLLEGVDVLIHLAGTSVERPLPEIIQNNLVALHAVYEGARRHRVKRIVFASSNHAFGMYPVDEKIGIDAPFRPDGLYGLSKVWGEAMARMYWDKHGIEGVSLRIGTAMGQPPQEPRHLSTWLGEDDLVELVMRCIEEPTVGYQAVWGVSANTRRYVEPAGSEALGFQARQNAEDQIDRMPQRPDPLDPIARTFQGGSFVTLDYTPPESRPRQETSA